MTVEGQGDGSLDTGSTPVYSTLRMADSILGDLFICTRMCLQKIAGFIPCYFFEYQTIQLSSSHLIKRTYCHRKFRGFFLKSYPVQIVIPGKPEACIGDGKSFICHD